MMAPKKMAYAAAALLSVAVIATVVIRYPAPAAPNHSVVRAETSLNPYILEMEGTYPQTLGIKTTPKDKVASSMGVTKDLYYQGRRVMKCDLSGHAYCVGLMFEVWFGAYEKAALSSGKPFVLGDLEQDSFRDFRREFYGFSGHQQTFVGALVKRGLGTAISPAEAEPGDLVQFWRNNGSGHAAVFHGWNFDFNGDPYELHYWSIQSRTGIARNSERVGKESNQIDPARIFVVRGHRPQ